MPIYINGKSLENIISLNERELSETEYKINIRSFLMNRKEVEREHAVTLRDIGFEYSHFERIDDWIKFLAML